MKTSEWLLHELKFPLPVLLLKLSQKLKAKITFRDREKTDLSKDHRKTASPIIQRSYVDMHDLVTDKLEDDVMKYLSERYCSHEFDLLGSGWVSWDYNAQARGFEGRSFNHNLDLNGFDAAGEWLKDVIPLPFLAYSQEIWHNLTHKHSEYVPIDWQKDIKTGFRWDARKWYKAQRTLSSGLKGPDLKMPWELARFQHLLPMAMAALCVPGKRARLILEFRSQVLDFIATNPPRCGVNWNCTMDVGIRTANLLVAYDLFSQLDSQAIIDESFSKIFSNSIHDHGRHIMDNLEFHGRLSSNHYLGNIAGLLFAGAYLDSSPESDGWLVFAVNEIHNEMDHQFYDDGGNFEGSAYYHRLSTEMMQFCGALMSGISGYRYKEARTKLAKTGRQLPRLKIQNLPGQIPTAAFAQKLGLASCLMADLLKPNGELPQFGDNDSGRFIKLTPVGEMITTIEAASRYAHLAGTLNNEIDDEMFWDENVLAVEPHLSLANGNFNDRSFETFPGSFPLEASFVKSLSGQKTLSFTNIVTPTNILVQHKTYDLKHANSTTFYPELQTETSLKQNIKVISYRDAGLFVLRSDRLYLAFNILSHPGQILYWGHVHNDKLSLELSIDGHDVLIDPGSYVYTPSIQRRNQFRCTAAHNVPLIEGEEQNRWPEGRKGAFRLMRESRCRILEFSADRIFAVLEFRKYVITREILINDESIVVNDASNSPFRQNWNKGQLYSRGYGKLVRREYGN